MARSRARPARHGSRPRTARAAPASFENPTRSNLPTEPQPRSRRTSRARNYADNRGRARGSLREAGAPINRSLPVRLLALSERACPVRPRGRPHPLRRSTTGKEWDVVQANPQSAEFTRKERFAARSALLRCMESASVCEAIAAAASCALRFGGSPKQHSVLADGAPIRSRCRCGRPRQSVIVRSARISSRSA